ncbi:pre-peptidase C-terminal domain-containing protein [Limnospira fusiformis]|uniref:pre-peptidase C-terminal domain-containing protein n=1 Tax=Limnospira fusiformis TaxID=54297 RepID=UPI00296E8823
MNIVPGDNISFDITATVPSDSAETTAIDLVFLTDLSGSFWDDLPVMQRLAPRIVKEVQDIQPDTKFGLASFIDKPIWPFGGSTDYVYETHLPLTDSLPDFQDALGRLEIGFGGDAPEAQLEGLMHVALREEEVGYRNNSRRIVVLSTDARYHEAGAGGAAGITTANNGDTVLDGRPAGTGEDYPSVAQVRNALEETGVIPIFAVTRDVVPVYRELVDQLGFGTVETLRSDSSNLVNVVTSGLETILSDLTMVARSDEYGYVQSINPVQHKGVKDGESRTFTVELGTENPHAKDDTLSLEVLGLGETTVNVTLGSVIGPDVINIGDLNGRPRPYSNNDRIGDREDGVWNSQDFYKFSISNDSEVNLTLDQLQANADVEILDGDGSTVIFRSTEPGRRPEEITENLGAGEYYIRVFPNSRSDRTSYRLWVSAEALDIIGEGKDRIATAENLGNIGPEEVSAVDRIGFGRGISRDTQDFFKFSITENSELSLTLDGLRANANVQLLGADGETIIDQSTNPGRQAEQISTDLEPGDYYVRVFPVGNARTDYRLGMSANPITIEDDDSKPGITLGPVTEANPVSQTGDVGFVTGRRRDTQDWYNFTLPVNSDVNLTLDRLRANLDVEILDEGGERVARGTNPGRQAEKIELEGLEAGTYYVKVTPVGNVRSNYRLGITAATVFIPDHATPEKALNFGKVEPGVDNIPSIRNSVGFTQGRSGRDERDWVRFELTKDGSVDINLTNLRQDINMRLYDGDGKTILQTAEERGRANENITDFLDAGVYYVEVFPNGNARSEYRLSINTGSSDALQEFDVGNLLSLEGGYTNSDRIGFAESGIRNTTDRYEFTLASEAEVDISLTGLRGNADIQLKETNGSLLFDSTRPGNEAEQISQELKAGTYYLDVVPVGNARTNYTLDITAMTDSVDPDGGPVPGSSFFNDLGVLTGDYSNSDRVGFGTGSSRDQVDYYGFRLNEAKSLAIALEGLSANINLELLDNSGSLIFESRNPGTADEKIEQELDPGTYYVAVRPQGSARSPYTLKIADLGVAVDPDGQAPGNVNNIGLLTDYRDTDRIGFPENGYRDVNDYRQFTLNERSSVDINLTGLRANADLELIGSDGRDLLQRSARPGNNDENIKTILDPGNYFVRVFPRGAARTPYEINMAASPITGSLDDTPPGQPLDPLTEGGSISQRGLIGYTEGGRVDTDDYYNFTLESPGFVTVGLDGLRANANLELFELLNNDRTRLLGSSRNPGSQDEEIREFLEPGTYVARVFSQGNQTPYNLSVSMM